MQRWRTWAVQTDSLDFPRPLQLCDRVAPLSVWFPKRYMGIPAEPRLGAADGPRCTRQGYALSVASGTWKSREVTGLHAFCSYLGFWILMDFVCKTPSQQKGAVLMI